MTMIMILCMMHFNNYFINPVN